jgi:hypothetical protein
LVKNLKMIRFLTTLLFVVNFFNLIVMAHGVVPKSMFERIAFLNRADEIYRIEEEMRKKAEENMLKNAKYNKNKKPYSLHELSGLYALGGMTFSGMPAKSTLGRSRLSKRLFMNM